MKIYEFKKNILEKVIIEITEFNGSDYLNIRTWFQDSKDIWRPSHKGITLALDKLEDLKKGVDLAYKKAVSNTEKRASL